MDVEEIKEFLKVDSDDLDGVIGIYQAAAEEYLQNAGVTKDYTKSLYKMIVTVFCGTLLENPTLLESKVGLDNVGLTFNAIIAQLRLSQ